MLWLHLQGDRETERPDSASGSLEMLPRSSVTAGEMHKLMEVEQINGCRMENTQVEKSV